MNAKERKAALAVCHALARCVSRAADKIGESRQYDRLRDVIARNEREHRAMGRRMVGTLGARMSVDAVCDYFVVRTMADAMTKYTPDTPIRALAGLRADYVLAALLACSPGSSHVSFVGAIVAQAREIAGIVETGIIRMGPASEHAAVIAVFAAAIDGIDYCDLVGGSR